MPANVIVSDKQQAMLKNASSVEPLGLPLPTKPPIKTFMKRRTFVQTTAVAASSCMLGSALPRVLAAGAARMASPPTRVITSGPKHHWFGYYDKWQFDPTDRYVLSNQVGFQHRTPRAEDTIGIGMVDTADENRWIDLGTSNAWGWQQGCMLQWVPGRGRKVVWNDREGDRHVCRFVDVATGERRTIDSPIYALSPDGKSAVTADFARIQDLRPGYGYVGLADPHRDELAPEESGIWRVDLESGARTLLFSIAQAAAMQPVQASMRGAKHYFNHLLVSPDGKRTIFLHRWRPDGGRGNFRTRMITIGMDGSDPYVLIPTDYTSHFIWRDAAHVLAWAEAPGEPKGYYVFRDQSDDFDRILEGVMPTDGHISYLPVGTGTEWVVVDTYPHMEKTPVQRVFLIHLRTNEKIEIGRFASPEPYRGEWRCDTHPRFSRDGKTICIDSPVADSGRQLHLIDVSQIVS